MSSEADEFERLMIIEAQLEIAKITREAERLLKKNVQSEVYDYYSPKVYNRSYDLENSIISKINTNEGVVYFDSNEICHTSVIDGNDVGYFTPKWLDRGHKDGTGIDNMFHNYPERNFIDKTIEELEQIYGKDCVEKIDN